MHGVNLYFIWFMLGTREGGVFSAGNVCVCEREKVRARF